MNYAKARKIIKLKRKILNTKGLGFFKKRLLDKHLWAFDYKSLAKAVFIGIFWMMIPMPFQMIPAIILCVYFRANIPIAIACVWLSNPITWLPMYFFNYLVGSYIMGTQHYVGNWHDYAMYMLNHLSEFWQPLYLGSIINGLALGFVLFSIIRFAGSFFRKD